MGPGAGDVLRDGLGEGLGLGLPGLWLPGLPAAVGPGGLLPAGGGRGRLRPGLAAKSPARGPGGARSEGLVTARAGVPSPRTASRATSSLTRPARSGTGVPPASWGCSDHPTGSAEEAETEAEDAGV